MSSLTAGDTRRPQATSRHPTAPSVLTMNGHFGAVGENPSKESFSNGIQVIDEDKQFNDNLPTYLQVEGIIRAGFNYHLISVFGSQSTGKSTLLNYLFGTKFGVMSEQERRQTTKGIWMSKNKNEGAGTGSQKMAENILVMDVEGTDGRERGEDQDFERKSALFALATSEVLIVNIWEHQVGLYQGANMGLLKTVFEVNLQLFLKNQKNVPRSLLFFVIRDHIGNTPLANLKETLLQDLRRIWTTLSKPPNLENSKIDDYFDFAFVALPHKVLQPEKFEAEVKKLGTRFREGYRDPKRAGLIDEASEGIFLPDYHRRIPADGFPHYAAGIWEQIDSNKDLDLPTQQELLAQFRCDEISKEVLVPFDAIVLPLEERQAEAVAQGMPVVLPDLGKAITAARATILKDFETEASRYHKGVYKTKSNELAAKVDGRLKALFLGQLSSLHKSGVNIFSGAVSGAVKEGQKRGSYDFSSIVQSQKAKAIERFDTEAKSSLVEGTSWSNYRQQLNLFQKDLDDVSARLRKEEMRRLAVRSERWVRSKLSESVALQFNSLGSGRAGSGAPADGEKPKTEKDLWDRIWNVFTDTVSHAETRFTERARSFDASPDEVEVGLWRLRRKSWGVLRDLIDEELKEGNLLLKLRENFEDKFRYDDEGVPRIWRPTDDIEGLYTRAREHTLELIPLLSRFKLSRTSAAPPLDAWIGPAPTDVTPADEDDLPPIGGVDEEDGKTLEDEMLVLSDAKRQDLATRFKKAADGIYVEAKRSAIGGITQVPLYFYGLLLALGWNELVAVLRNPVYFILLALIGVGAYVTWTLNLWGPIISMSNAASAQGLEIAKVKLREFLESSETGRQAIGLSEKNGIGLDTLHSNGTTKSRSRKNDDEELDEI